MDTVRLPGPFLTVYTNPLERLIFDPVRDANPFFHLIDALWLFSGSNKVDLPRTFLARITDFSDDGQTFHGAYGQRLRYAYGFDQIDEAVNILTKTPDSRQVVLSIWHPEQDLGAKTKDMPCNDMIMLDIVDDQLCMTVCNRSNDVIWGAYGANVVQFSMLQELMAAMIGVGVGPYCQMSNNFHVYVTNPYWEAHREGKTHKWDPYQFTDCKPATLAATELEARAVLFDSAQLAACAEAGGSFGQITWSSPFFERTVAPMLQCYGFYKQGHLMHALNHVDEIEALDWRLACTEWLTRRYMKEQKA
jgi:hypothetical protein